MPNVIAVCETVKLFSVFIVNLKNLATFPSKKSNKTPVRISIDDNITLDNIKQYCSQP